MAEQRSLEINVISAQDLQDVNFMTKMDVYAVVSISGDHNSRQKVKTGVDRGCGTNPTWNFPMKLSVDESLARNNRLTLAFRLVCDRSLGDKEVGEVNVPVKELLDSVNAAGEGAGAGGMKFVSYQVRKPSGRPKGELNFSYRFGEKITGKIAAGDPVTAFPAAAGSSYPPPMVVAYGHAHGPPPVTGYAPPPQPQPFGGPRYPPPPTGYGYGYAPPPPGYGYGYQAPVRPGYGYGPPAQQGPLWNNKSKLGLGLGLGTGLVGGMVIGDMVSDVASYDPGFGGFDF